MASTSDTYRTGGKRVLLGTALIIVIVLTFALAAPFLDLLGGHHSRNYLAALLDVGCVGCGDLDGVVKVGAAVEGVIELAGAGEGVPGQEHPGRV